MTSQREPNNKLFSSYSYYSYCEEKSRLPLQLISKKRGRKGERSLIHRSRKGQYLLKKAQIKNTATRRKNKNQGMGYCQTEMGEGDKVKLTRACAQVHSKSTAHLSHRETRMEFQTSRGGQKSNALWTKKEHRTLFTSFCFSKNKNKHGQTNIKTALMQ